MPKPIIAITAGRGNVYTRRKELRATWSGCSVDYIKGLLRAGAAPVLLPYLAGTRAIAATLDAVGGVLLTGGGDVVSRAYGEHPHPKSRYQNAARDRTEFEVVRAAVDRGVPILGICRGPQAINVALGGTLVQDIPSQVEGAIEHYGHDQAPDLLHTVDIEPDSLLAAALGTSSLSVNSWHHQAVKELGHGLRVNCRATDGVIEGVESSEGKPILAVQWHPEEIAEDYPQFQKLFDWLVEEARRFISTA